MGKEKINYNLFKMIIPYYNGRVKKTGYEKLILGFFGLNYQE